jgi:predicted DCC family thiol-disulfide oxidoreductase YuxK
MTTSTKLAIEDAPYKVLYDGDCQFCRESVKLLKQLDQTNLTEPVALTEQVLHDLHVPASMDECFAQMHVVSRSGEMFVGYFAIVRLAKLFPKTRLLAWLAEHLVPAAIGSRLYRLVANNRYRFRRCDSGRCKLR